jgi:glyoxylase-like metal-dependent hydrolase (beta-lactamase superfamily II)
MKKIGHTGLIGNTLVPKGFVSVSVVVAACVAQSPVALAQALKPARPLSIAPVKDGLYVITGEGGNVAVYVTPEGVVLVDDMFYRNYDDMVAIVATVSDKPIEYVLNTHQHDDHAGGNAKMSAIASVIAHDNVRKNLEHIRQPYYEDTPGTPIGLPSVTFSREIVVHVGGKEIRAQHFGRGHTSGDAVVYFPDAKTIHTGDLFLSFPRPADKPPGAGIYVDYAQGGSFLEWTDTLDRVLALDFDTVISGHGPVATRADLVKFRANVAAMRDRIAALIRSGASKQHVLTVFEMDYGWKSTGCPPSPPTGGCLQFQQMDSLLEELRQ